MANENYRQQTPSGLQSEATCSTCQPDYIFVEICSGLQQGLTYQVDASQGYNGCTGGLQSLTAVYEVGDYVCITATNNGTRYRAEIISVTNVGVPNRYIDTLSAVSSACSPCLNCL